MLEFITLLIVGFCLWKARKIIRLNKYVENIKKQITEFIWEVEEYEPIIIVSMLEDGKLELEKTWDHEWPITINICNQSMVAQNSRQLVEYLRVKGELILETEELYKKLYGICIDSKSEGYEMFMNKLRSLRIIQLKQQEPF